MLLAGNTNTAVCRDAARSASRTVPSKSDRDSELSPTSPVYLAAKKTIEDYKISGEPWISRPILQSVSISGLKRHDNEDVGGTIEGMVTVSCLMHVLVPVSFGQLLPESIELRKSFSYPITAVAELEESQ